MPRCKGRMQLVGDDTLYVQRSSTLSSAGVRSSGKQHVDVKQLVNTTDSGFDLNKARHEVRQLGIKGLTSESKEDAILNKLIQLGAKVHDYCMMMILT